MQERRSGDGVEEEYSSGGYSDDEFQTCQIERVLELTVEIGRMKKMQCMTNNQIDAINTRSDIDENNVVKKTQMSAD